MNNYYSFFNTKQKKALKRILGNKSLIALFDLTYYLSDKMTKKDIKIQALKLGLNVGRDRKKIMVFKVNKKIKYIRYLYFNDYYFK